MNNGREGPERLMEEPKSLRITGMPDGTDKRQIPLPDGKTGDILFLPDGRKIDFPFLTNASVDAIVVNDDGIIIAYLFINPQKIELENIICPRSMGYLNGEIFTSVISIDIEEKYCNIHLIEPIEIVTRFLGIIRVQTLGVDANCNFVTFVRAEE